MTAEDRAPSADPYRMRQAAAELALAQQWDIPVRTASTIIESWARTIDVRAAEIADSVLDEVYRYWRRHGAPQKPGDDGKSDDERTREPGDTDDR